MALDPGAWAGVGGSAEYNRALAMHMMKQGMDFSPIASPWQGVARMANALVSGLYAKDATDAESKGWEDLAKAYATARSAGFSGAPGQAPAPMPSGSPSAASGVPAQPVRPDVRPSVDSYGKALDAVGGPTGSGSSFATSEPGTVSDQRFVGAQPSGGPASMDVYRQAIRNIESSGGNHRAVGPVIQNPRSAYYGDRAYGADQVMGRNIPAWTQAALGRSLTPQEFLNDPEAQNAVFNHRFGGYVSQYGPENAASMWFTGRKASDPRAQASSDGYTKGADYVGRFTRDVARMGGGAPQGGPEAPWQAPSQGSYPGQEAPPRPPAPIPAPAQQPAPAQAGGPPAGLPPEVMAALRNPNIPAAGKMALLQAMAPNATYGKIGVDEMGRDIMGWIDTTRRSVTRGPIPTAAEQQAARYAEWERSQQGQPQQPGAAPRMPAVPPPPPGVDPKSYYEEMGKRTAANLAGNMLPGTSEEAAKMRGEIRALPSYKNLAEAAPIYKNMLQTAGVDSKASDLNLVYSLGKIFDPGSVVREGEMVMVKKTGSLPDWLVGAINSLNGGAALTPETRKAILEEAHTRIQSYQSMFDQDVGHYRGIATRNRIAPEDVLPDFGKFERWNGQPRVVAPPPGTPAPAQPAPAPATSREQLFKKFPFLNPGGK